MTRIDFSPLYRNSIGFDRLAALLEGNFPAEQGKAYPPYDIEAIGDNDYAITMVVAGFTRDELDINFTQGVLSVRGNMQGSNEARKFLHKGIASQDFEQKFNLAEHVEVTGASLNNGVLTINLHRELPDAMKPRRIMIESGTAPGKAALVHEAKASGAA